MGGDLVVDRVRPHQLADQFPSRPGGAHPHDPNAIAEFLPEVAEPGGHDLDGPPVGAHVDLLDQSPGLVNQGEVGAHGADVNSETELDRAASDGNPYGRDPVAQEGHAIEGEWRKRGKSAAQAPRR